MLQIPDPDNESDRLAALASYHILDTLPEKDFEELTQLAADICQTPIALVSLIDDKRQWFKANVGLNATQTPKEYAFCAYTITNINEMTVVKDARKDDRFASNPLVRGNPNIVFYAGVPLISADGYPIGSLCVIDHQPKDLTEKQAQSLRILAKQVITQMELRKKLVVLEKANQVLLEANIFIKKFASTAAHDIKNPLSSILLTSQALQMHLKKADDEKSLRLVTMNIAATKVLHKLVDEMLAYSLSPALLITGQQSISLNELLSKVLTMMELPANVNVTLPPTDHTLTCSVVALEQIFLNLLGNAVRYNDKDIVMIGISFNETAEAYHFKIADNGIGVAPQHLEKIFEQDFTLNIIDRFNKQGTGIGLATVKVLIEKLNGKISAESAIGEGTTFAFDMMKQADTSN